MKVKPQRWLTKNLKTCFKDHFIVRSDYVRLWKARLGLNLNKLKCFEDKIPQKFPSSLRSLKKRLLYSMFFFITFGSQLCSKLGFDHFRKR